MSSRDERYSNEREICSTLKIADGHHCTGGPILYVKHGKKYYDDSEAHIKNVGNTGMGKSSCVAIPYARNVIDAGESGIYIDPKGEIYNRTSRKARKTHKVYTLDFRNPALSPDKLNILELAYKNIISGDVVKRDVGRAQIRTLVTGLFPVENEKDPFWNQSASRYVSGLIYTLFELGREEEINLNSITEMIGQSEEKLGGGTLLKTIYDELFNSSLAKRDLATYITAPNETRASIHSVAANGFSLFSNSEGLMNLLCESTINLFDFDVTKPFIFYIILPDEDDVYDTIAGLIISMFTQHLIKIAQDRFNGHLPIRVNVILEEIGSVGKSIPNLPNLMSASRSRNMRIMVCLQSDEQLMDVYGKSKARAIDACFGITIAFSTNDDEMLEKWSKRLGERKVMIEGKLADERLATPNQIRAMPVGMALIFVGNKLKFFARLPFYDDMFDSSNSTDDKKNSDVSLHTIPAFSLRQTAEDIRQRKLDAVLGEKLRNSPLMNVNDVAVSMKESDEKKGRRNKPNLDVTELAARIDAKIAELESEQEERKPGGFFEEFKEKECSHLDVFISCTDNLDTIVQTLVKRRIVGMKRVEYMGNSVVVHATSSNMAQKIKLVALKFGASVDVV